MERREEVRHAWIGREKGEGHWGEVRRVEREKTSEGNSYKGLQMQSSTFRSLKSSLEEKKNDTARRMTIKDDICYFFYI